MKILVPCKRVPDADQKLTVHSDGKRIITEHLPHLLNPFDAIAVEEALRMNLPQVSLGAQVSAIPFYEGAGFQTYGDVFLDAGIDHKMMKRVLG